MFLYILILIFSIFEFLCTYLPVLFIHLKLNKPTIDNRRFRGAEPQQNQQQHQNPSQQQQQFQQQQLHYTHQQSQPPKHSNGVVLKPSQTDLESKYQTNSILFI